MIELGTSYILPNEPCFNLSELDLMSPMGEKRRYRVYIVVRNDRLARYQEDLGAAENFKTDQIRVAGGVVDAQTKRIFIEHTVNELREIIDTLRARDSFDILDHLQLDKIRNN